ncbi:hypothetical protein QFC19_003395 [Naganishia cerealis]|uniref:Uncharacterized protein n=1 Tax=Naganishia cerealis TaxID=610337 RepID=A0ACC2W5D1_9TREE|nr:hypothetical protein QFC19_003395 [Naganishia cerealis]
MSMDPHYLWAAGHFLLLSSTARIVWAYTIGLFSKAPLTNFWYRAAYIGTLVSYAIVVLKSLGQPALNQTYLQRALKDENVQYALLALYWFVSKPVYSEYIASGDRRAMVKTDNTFGSAIVSLIPFATFSLFHCLTFVRSTIIPKIAKQPAVQQPRTSTTTTAGATQPSPTPASGLAEFGKKLGGWTKQNYDPAMRFVSQAELGILGWVILRAVTFRGSFLTAIFLAHFIRMRYISSAYTRQAVASATGTIDRLLVGKPPALVNAWGTIKTVTQNWMKMTMPATSTPQQQQQQQQAGNGAAAGRPQPPVAGRR